MRVIAEQAFSRAAGAPLVSGNHVRVLKDAGENYPAWLAAIRGAQEKIYFENYIVSDDGVGREFVAALAERAHAGVRVRVIYDWLGGWGTGSHRLWRPLIAAGGEVRCFNPPRLARPFAWLERDHRKLIAVDGMVGFVSGLCVSSKWTGRPERGQGPWRDTGLELRGRAVADLEDAFADSWAEIGRPLPPGELTEPESIAPAGNVSVRVLATRPNTARLYRLDQLIAAMARRSLWIADAYFIGVAAYVQALRAAAMDGVDVRLLVPGSSDVPIMSPLSRSGYRPLLEAGVRVFEWNGMMMHAKTAVADGRWARIGSSNLNLSSWMGNRELDVAVEDEGFAEGMQTMYEADLANTTEITLARRNRVRPSGSHRHHGRRAGSASRAAAGALRIGNTVTAAITNRHILGPAEAGTMGAFGAVLIGIALLALLWPWVIAVPLAILAGWIGISMIARGYELGREADRAADAAATPPDDAAG